jgi:hypothetical protein
MAIRDDWLIDDANKRLVTTQTYVNDIPPNIYSVNEFYTFIQDEFDEPGRLQYSVPISAQTPSQYRLEDAWFIDDESPKSLYGGSLDSAAWAYVASPADGITQLRWTVGSTDAPTDGDIGVVLTGGSSTATGILLKTNATKRIAWVRNTSANQFQANENVTGTGVDLQTETSFGVASGQSTWGNLYSVGVVQPRTEIYVAQEDDFMGGNAQGGGGTYPIKVKITPWWDADVDFAAVSPNPVNQYGIDLLVKIREAGTLIDGGRLAGFARQGSKVYWHFELILTGGQGVLPFASTGTDLNILEGPRQIATGAFSTAFIDGEEIVGGTSGAHGRLIANTTDTNLRYYLLGKDLTDFQSGEVITGQASGCTATSSGAPTTTTNGPADAEGVTVDFGYVTGDIDQDSTLENYAAEVDCNNVPLQRVYEKLMYRTWRGAGDQGATWLPDADGGNEDGEFYRAAGDVFATLDAQGGTGLTEGQVVEGSLSGATGVVVAYNYGGVGYRVVVLTQIKGTFVDNDVLDAPTPSGNSATIDGTPESISANPSAPFGNFAGGVFFFARGIVPINVPAGDSNNFTTTTLENVLKTPPTQIAVEFSGVAVNDRLFIAEVTVSGGRIVKTDQNSVGAAGAAQGASSIPLDSTPPNDTPAAETIRIVDVSTGYEHRYRVGSWTGTTVTLAAVTEGTGVTTGSATQLIDTSATFTGGNVQIGDLVRNTFAGKTNEVWRVTKIVDANTLNVVPWEGSPTTPTDWDVGDTYEINLVVDALVDADDVYFPYMDRVADATLESQSLIYVSDRNVVARYRFSSSEIGGQKIFPGETTGVAITSSGLSVAANRLDDDIAAP